MSETPQSHWLNPRDGLALAGLVLTSAGAAWVYPPAGLIVPGVILLAGAIWGHLYGPAR